ncbi:hypothetical protein [Deminuibacter soli]|uniref:Uncharacterized protein n=1 Tax=Deminuibacter soli TaxID=2291815 RepID=A0A3E1NHC6_9BACT|nr:hypothetical protein [Deminuibacter soli]RFM27350.1 hypothetical protein DXN05_15095 [Deminuibacter soli]
MQRRAGNWLLNQISCIFITILQAELQKGIDSVLRKTNGKWSVPEGSTANRTHSKSCAGNKNRPNAAMTIPTPLQPTGSVLYGTLQWFGDYVR